MEDRAFLHHSGLSLRRDAGLAIGPAAANERAVFAAGPIDGIALVRRVKREKPDRAVIVRGPGKQWAGVVEFGSGSASPAARAFAAKAGIGEQPEGGFHAGVPGGIVCR